MRTIIALSDVGDLGVVSPHYANLKTSGGSGSRLGVQAVGGGQPAGAGGTPIAGNMTGSPSGQLRPIGTNVGPAMTKYGSASSKMVRRSSFAATQQGARVQIGTGNLLAGGLRGRTRKMTDLPGGLSGIHSSGHMRDAAPPSGRYPDEGLFGLDGIFDTIGKGFGRTFTNLWRTASVPVVKVFTNPTKLNIGDAAVLVSFGAATPFVSAGRNPRDIPYLAATAAAGAGAVYLMAPAATVPLAAGTPIGSSAAGGVMTVPAATASPLMLPPAMVTPAAAPIMTSAATGLPAYAAGTAPLVAGAVSTAPAEIAVGSAASGGTLMAPASLATPASSGGSNLLGWLGTAAVKTGKVLGTAALTAGTQMLVAGAMPRTEGALMAAGSTTVQTGGEGGGTQPLVIATPGMTSGGGTASGSDEAPTMQASMLSNPMVIAGIAIAGLFLIKKVVK